MEEVDCGTIVRSRVATSQMRLGVQRTAPPRWTTEIFEDCGSVCLTHHRLRSPHCTIPLTYGKRTIRWIRLVLFTLPLSLSMAGCGDSKPIDQTTTGSAKSRSQQFTTNRESQLGGSPEKLPVAPPLVDAGNRDAPDPTQEGWESERVSELADRQLHQLRKLFTQSESLDEKRCAELITPDFTCTWLSPTVERVYQDESVTVAQMRDPKPENGAVHRGASGLVAALGELREPIRQATDIQVHFKIFRVDVPKIPKVDIPQVNVKAPSATTKAYFEASGTTPDGKVQQNAIWTCQWTASTAAAELLLASIEIDQFEQVTSHVQGGTLLADCTEAVLGMNQSLSEQLVPSVDHWLGTLELSLDIAWPGHHGLAIGDVNGDGLDDLYLCQPGGLPNRLFVQQPDGSARDVSAEVGVDLLDFSQAALLIDQDNDGDQDLVIAARSDLILLANDGRGNFSHQVTIPCGLIAASLSAADFDGDADLDLYVCGVPERSDAPVPYHDANNGIPNVLLRNEGPGQFTDATKESGLDENNRRYSFASSWEDYDNDGDLDLYVANDFGRNNLYRNEGGKFTDVAAEAGVEDISAGMGVTWADTNQDGWMDLYVSNMFSSAGNRVAYQRKFRLDDPLATKALFQRHARGNSLFENAGDGTFRDVSVEAGVTMGRWAWGSHFVDLNNDGLEDLVVANGYVTNDDSHDL